MEELGWKEHHIKKGDGKGNWNIECGLYRMLHLKEYSTYNYIFPFGIVNMMNGRLMLLGGAEYQSKESSRLITITHPMVSFSEDSGDTWTEFSYIDETGETNGRPMGLAYLGNGCLTFKSAVVRFVSYDYGRTWDDRFEEGVGNEGSQLAFEGNPLVEYDKDGNTPVLTQLCYFYPGSSHGHWPEEPVLCECMVRTRDMGRSWIEEYRPQEWIWQEEYKGKVYTRTVNEGSIIRARNGWLVASLRTDMPPKYFEEKYNDNLEGTGVSISKDDGKTWSPINTLYFAGRHHSHLILMPNGDIVMTLIVRCDIRDGSLASYRRGCEAIVSRDNGLTWDLNRKYILDDYEFFSVEQNGTKPFWVNGTCGHLSSTLLDDGHIITAYANYLTRGASLIKWKP